MAPIPLRRFNQNNQNNNTYTTYKKERNYNSNFEYDFDNNEKFKKIGKYSDSDSSSCSNVDIYENQFVCLFRNKKGINKGKICGCPHVLRESDLTRCRLHLDKI